MDKLFGNSLDEVRYNKLTDAYIDFVKAYSPLLDEAEKLNQDLLASKFILEENDTEEREYLVNCMVDTLTTMVPLFVKFSSYMDQLKEQYNVDSSD